MIRFVSFLALAFCGLFLSGCYGNVQKFDDARPQVVAAPDGVSARLADAADKAAEALQTLSSIEHQRSPGVAAAPIAGAPPELKRAITVRWVGPVEPITKTLADRASYSFLTVGTAPPVPLVVTLDVENKTVVEALREIGIQLGVQADIRVDSARRTVEIHYPPNTGIGQEF